MNKIYGSINKSETMDDGTLKVWGIASSSSVDSDGEIITAEAMQEALEDYMKFGAIREMHGSNAAGTALEIAVDLATGLTHICALIVDPIAILKIRKGVYKAWSIGGKALEKVGNMITKLKLVEVSLVDRPANPDSVFTMYKAEIVDNEKQIDNNNKNKEEIMPKENDNKPEVEVNQEENLDTNKTESNNDIKKSFSDVAWIASILSDLKCLQECLRWEKDWENDDSKIPSDLKDVIKQLADILVASAKEETNEVIAEIKEESKKSEKSEDLNKSSKLDDEVIKQIYALALSLQPKDISKSEVNEDLNKFAEVKNDLEKALKTNESLTKRVKELEDMPAAPKAHLHVTDKEEDLGKSNTQEKVIKNHKGEVDEIATAFLKAQQTPTIVKF